MKRALLLAAATLLSIAIGGSIISTANAGAPGNTMILDADAATGGTQGSINVASGSFTIGIDATNINTSYQAYQWQIGWDSSAPISPTSATSNDDGDPVWDSASSNLILCAPASTNPGAPVGETWYGTSAGCAGLAAVTFAGRLALITLNCTDTGSIVPVSIRLVGVADDAAFGSTYLAPGGAEIATTLGTAITVNCGTGTAATPTNTPTATNTPPATNTPGPTNTPAATNTPMPSPTLIPLKSTTASPTGTATPGGETPPAGETPGPGEPTQPGGGPGAGQTTPTRTGVIRPPDTGSGGDSASMLLVLSIAGAAVLAGSAGAAMLWRGASARRAR